MKRQNSCIKEFKNGNINIKYDRDTIKYSIKDAVLTISEVLYWLDCYFIGETFCLSNWETGHLIYNLYSDLVYIFPWSALDDLKARKTVKLYARRPDKEDRELIQQEEY